MLVAEDPVVDRAALAMLAMQRGSWEHGVASHALLDLGREELAGVLACDAVDHQRDDGRIAEVDGGNAVNSGSLLEVVDAQARRTGDPAPAAAVRRQLEWLLLRAPRADDGTLFHVVERPEVWADTVYMVVPGLVATGHVDEAARQLEGHRRRLLRADGLVAHVWDEGQGRFTRADAWGGGCGWVVAACARGLRLLRRAPPSDADAAFGALAAEVGAAVLEACLRHRAPSGLVHDVVDDPSTFEEATLVCMLAYAALSGARDGWLGREWERTGRELLATARERVGADGVLRPACDSPSFARPGSSCEGQAWFCLAAAAASAE